MEVNNEMLLNEMEKDVIGEVMNISLGSSATSLSSLLNKRVDITVPRVNDKNIQSFEFDDFQPAIGVEIKYTEGINGHNVLILKKSDIKVILETLMSIEIPDDEFVLDEIAMSAVSEVMNQMMGSAATALADFLGRPVNISTPVAYEITDKESFLGRYFTDESIVEVRFDLKVGDVINSEFLNVFSLPLAKEMVNLFLKGTGIEQDAIGEMLTNQSSAHNLEKRPIQEKEQIKEPSPRVENTEKYEPRPEPKEEIPVPKQRFEEKVQQPRPSEMQRFTDNEPKRKINSYEDDSNEEDETLNSRRPKKRKMPDNYDDYDDSEEYEERPRRAAPPSEKKTRRTATQVNVAPMQYDSFDDDEEILSEEQKTNLGLIMSVPLQITVEIGRTKKKIKDILEFSQGTIVELDKQAGTHVDIIINGQVIAKGDVVVINDNFGVRVSEIIKKDEIFRITT
jgi:flagellar motor switch protein FliN/FliY